MIDWIKLRGLILDFYQENEAMDDPIQDVNELARQLANKIFDFLEASK